MNVTKSDEQAALLVKLVPVISRRECFAMYGGTAINLFLRNMPRYSVDIDLVYLNVLSMSEARMNIASELAGIGEDIKSAVSGARILPPGLEEGEKDPGNKILVECGGVEVKVEVNPTCFGAIAPLEYLPICAQAQEEFGEDAHMMRLLHRDEIYAGKFRAAMVRQRDKDTFDIRQIMGSTVLSPVFKAAFMRQMLVGRAPFHEAIAPALKSKRPWPQPRFFGRPSSRLTYDEHVAAFEHAVRKVQGGLTRADKQFLLGAHCANPDWSIYDLSWCPGVQDRQRKNLAMMKQNPEKHRRLQAQLVQTLDGMKFGDAPPER